MRANALLLAVTLTACSTAPVIVADPVEPDVRSATVEPQTQVVRASSPPVPGPPLSAAEMVGEFQQGGYIRGTAPFGAISATYNGKPVLLDRERGFFVGLDRDAEGVAELIFTASDRQKRTHRIPIAPRQWDIERVNVAKRPSGSSEAWWARREPEWLAIQAARAKETDAEGWRQDFIWPVEGRISGRFGRQRIYRGEPGSYHSGLDIAARTGTPFVAPADGVVVLAATGFSLEGQLLIIDHGQGLNSAFLHCSRILVSEGDRVRQGQIVGEVGSTGRSTGPHLHWGIKWRDARLDPLLFLP